MNSLSTDITPLPSASLRKRLLCMVYEAMLLLGVLFIATWAFSTLFQQRHALYLRDALQDWLFVVLGMYFCWIWTHGGQTLAMKTWHIQILDKAGQPLSQTRAFLRYVLSWVWFLPPMILAWPFKLPAAAVAVLVFAWILIWALLSRFQSDRQYWHDVWAGTQLVDVQKQP